MNLWGESGHTNYGLFNIFGCIAQANSSNYMAGFTTCPGNSATPLLSTMANMTAGPPRNPPAVVAPLHNPACTRPWLRFPARPPLWWSCGTLLRWKACSTGHHAGEVAAFEGAGDPQLPHVLRRLKLERELEHRDHEPPTETSSAGVCFQDEPRRRDGLVVEIADPNSLAVGEEQKHVGRSLARAAAVVLVGQLERPEAGEHGEQLLLEQVRCHERRAHGVAAGEMERRGEGSRRVERPSPGPLEGLK